MYRAGSTLLQIYRGLHVGYERIYKVLENEPRRRNLKSLDLDEAGLLDEYENGASMLELAHKHGCAENTINRRLRRLGAVVRKGRRPIKWSPSSKIIAGVLDGCLLGDADVTCASTKRAGWLDQVKEAFQKTKLESSIRPRINKPALINGRMTRPGPFLIFRTAYTPGLLPSRKRWYIGGKKIVPKDIKLTPVSTAFWFSGDGSGSATALVFYTNGFSKAGVDRLIRALKRDLGVHAARNKADPSSSTSGWKIQVFRVADKKKLADLIRPHMPACCFYKLRFIGISVRKYVASRRVPGRKPGRPPSVAARRR